MFGLFNSLVAATGKQRNAFPVPYNELASMFSANGALPFVVNDKYDHFVTSHIKLPAFIKSSKSRIFLKNPSAVITIFDDVDEDDEELQKLEGFLKNRQDYDTAMLREAKMHALSQVQEGHLRETLRYSDRMQSNEPQIPKNVRILSISAGIFGIEYQTLTGKTGLAVIIKPDPHPLALANTCTHMAFGMHGRLDDDGMVWIDKLLIPAYENNRYKGLEEIEPTEDNINRYLRGYAATCVRQMHDKGHVNAQANIKQVEP